MYGQFPLFANGYHDVIKRDIENSHYENEERKGKMKRERIN